MEEYLSIIVPLYNEEESVENLVDKIIEAGRTFKNSFEILLIDDGSSDKTWEIITTLSKEKSFIKAIKFRRNYGQTAAMVAGFDHASGDIIITMDGDLQNDPKDIPRLLEKIEEGYDIVSGWRKNRKDHFSRVLPSKIANKIISLTTGVKLHDYGCSLKAYRTECIRSINAYGEMHRFLPALASMTGARVTEMPVTHHPRQFGVSKYGFDRIFKVFNDIFAINLIIHFSSNPLRGFFIFALPFLFLTLFFGGIGVFAFLFSWTAGKSTFFIILSALTGMAVIHLVSLGVIGELVLGTSDFSHTFLPEMTKKIILSKEPEPYEAILM